MHICTFQRVISRLPIRDADGTWGNILDVRNMKRGGYKFIHFTFSFVNIDFFRTADWRKNAGILARRLTLSQEQIAVIFQRRMENSKERALEHRLEINHHVPAADQIQFPKGRIGEHVMRSEDDHPADLLGNDVLVVFLSKEPGQTVRRDIVQDTFIKHTFACLFDGSGIYVCGKDLDIPLHIQLVHHLPKEDRQRIGFFSGGTSRAPHPDRLLFPCTFHDGIDGISLQFFEKGRIPKEIRHPDENFLDQHAGLFLIVFQKIHILRQIGTVCDHHPPLDPPQHSGSFIIGKVDAADLF